MTFVVLFKDARLRKQETCLPLGRCIGHAFVHGMAKAGKLVLASWREWEVEMLKAQ
jgi:hypothetical protein